MPQCCRPAAAATAATAVVARVAAMAVAVARGWAAGAAVAEAPACLACCRRFYSLREMISPEQIVAAPSNPAPPSNPPSNPRTMPVDTAVPALVATFFPTASAKGVTFSTRSFGDALVAAETATATEPAATAVATAETTAAMLEAIVCSGSTFSWR